MTIGTGYFSKAKAYSDDGWCLVNIALKKPWFLPVNLQMTDVDELSPTAEILALKDTPAEYEKTYEAKVLSKVNWLSLYAKLREIAKAEAKEKVVLLCYESPAKFCHRHIVARWLERHLGVPIKEVELQPKPIWDIFDSDSLP